MNNNLFPSIVTERLVLRKIEKVDSAVILFLRSDKIVNQFIERPVHRQTKTIEDAVKFIEILDEGIENCKSITWGISLREGTVLIGTICLWNFSENRKEAEIGYDLNPEYHGKGIMSEAMKAVLNYGFDTRGFEKIEAFTHANNEKSKQLLLKHGFNVTTDKRDIKNESNLIFERKKALR
jgi:ribosomal-protein-alanine N-acetyltransferase